MYRLKEPGAFCMETNVTARNGCIALDRMQKIDGRIAEGRSLNGQVSWKVKF